MRDISSALQAFLLSKAPMWVADLFTVTLLDGTVIRWTSCDHDVVVGVNTWTALGPCLERSRLNVKNTVEVPELELTLLARPTDTVEGVPVTLALHSGLFDGARIQLDRLFMPSPGDTSLGTCLLFNGRMSKAEITETGGKLTAKGDNVLMNQYAPRNQYQTNCLHSFCDPGCTLNPATYTASNTVGASPSTILIPWGTVPGTPALYTFGKIKMTSGAASGQIRTVALASGAGLQLSYPLYELPAAGDTFTVLQGCDRTQATCSGTYSNLAHFRGFPFIPPVETAF